MYTECGQSSLSFCLGVNFSSDCCTIASLVIFDNLAGMSPPTEMIKMGKRRSLSCERLLDEISKFSGKEGA